ncbi:MAG: alkaline phosphatase family protein [Nannocystaceae bacterium]|nr:alkaline phosphatase family protein [Nannocystaceae bacterium]
MTTKTLFIGLDGATFTVLDDLTLGPDPVMPFMAKLLAEGSRSALRSTPNPLTPPAWVSLMTGRSPGHHGVFDFIRAEETDNDVYFTLYDSRDCRVETIWSIISRQGQRVAALNFPFTAPPPADLNGFMVPGFVPWRHLRRNCAPKNLYDQLKKIPDFNPKELAWDFEQEKQALDELSDEDREGWIRYHLPREMQWFRIAEHLLENEAPELMAVMFDGVDKLQHQAWLYLDPAEQKGELSDYHKRMRVLCLDYFRQLDTFIERLVTKAGPEANVFLASDHGFTATDEIVRINTFLAERGYLHWVDVPKTEAGRRREDSMFAYLDWERTVAYCGTPSSNGITIRVADAPGKQGVDPQEYEAVRNRLIADLEDFRDPVSGERIITEVHRREDVFSGEAMKDAPDLLLVLRDHGFVSIKNKEPAVEPRPSIAGTHHPDGIFIAYGPGIRPGALLPRRNIVDVGATLVHSLGLDVPEDFEGVVPEAMYTDDHLMAHPVTIGASTVNAARNEEAGSMSSDDKDQIMAQLQMLGYVE